MSRGSHSDILNDLGARLAADELSPGDVITVADLEHRYDASRTLIREAVRVLESIGMVTSRRRVGITVSDRSEWNSLDSNLIRWNLAGPHRQAQLEALVELRVAVEPVAASLAAQRSSTSEGLHLVDLANELHRLGERKLGHSKEYLEVDIEFHSLLLRASRNPLFYTLTTPVSDILRGRAALGLTPADPDQSALEGHLRAAQAVADRDSQAAEAAVRLYISRIWEEIATD